MGGIASIGSLNAQPSCEMSEKCKTLFCCVLQTTQLVAFISRKLLPEQNDATLFGKCALDSQWPLAGWNTTYWSLRTSFPHRAQVPGIIYL